MKTRALLLLLVLLSTLPACAFKRRHRCTATASYSGKTISGKGDDFNDEAKARENARKSLCDDHCQNQDPAVDAAIKAVHGRPPQDLVERINLARNPPVRVIFDACVTTCSAAVPEPSVKYTCENSGI